MASNARRRLARSAGGGGADPHRAEPGEVELSDRDLPSATPAASGATEATPVWFRRLTFYSVTSALCALIPIPFLDEHLLKLTRRRLVRETAATGEVELTDVEVMHLSGTEPRGLFGCLLGTVIRAVLKGIFLIVRRVFRSVLFFLALKDAVDEASRTFHEGFLLHRTIHDLPARLGLDVGSAEGPLRTPVRDLRSAIVLSCREVDPRPIEKTIKRVFRGSHRLLRRAARLFARDARREHLDDTGPLPEGGTGAAYVPAIAERLADALAGQRDYLADLERRLRRRWPPGNSSPGDL